MIALDTNVLVRYLTEDDEAQAARAAALIEGAIDREETMFVTHIVLCELAWVLGGPYRRSRRDIHTAITGLLAAAQLLVEDAEMAHRANARYRSGRADFADYLIGERASAAGCQTVATFDKKLLREDGFLEP